MNPFSFWSYLPLVLLVACASGTPLNTPERSPEPLPEPLPEPSGPEASTEPQTAPPIAAAVPPAELEPALMWDRQLEKIQLVGKRGTLMLGTSPCQEGALRLIVRVERPGDAVLQNDLYPFIGCELKRDGKGWKMSATTDAETPAGRFQLNQAALDAATVAVVVDFDLGLERQDDVLLISKPGEFRHDQFGRLSSGAPDLVVTPKGELLRVFSPAQHDYWVGLVTVDADGTETETQREAFLARVSEHGDKRGEAQAAVSDLEERCPTLAGRVRTVSAPQGSPMENWLGVPALSREQATAASRELKACGITASVERLPPAETAPAE